MTSAQLAAIVREHTALAVTAAVTPLVEANKALELRILELETRPAVLGPPGAKGDRGEVGPCGAGIASVVISAESRLMAHLTDGRTLDAGPVPRGIDGAPGPKGDPGERGEKGLDGKDGASGLNGKDGANGLDGKDGAPGLDGKDGRDGLDGKDGAAGFSGKDGIGVMDAMLDRSGHLILTLSDGRTKDVGLITGRDADPLEMKRLILEEVAKMPPPKDGRDGKDGAPGLDGKDGRDGLDGNDGRDGMDGKDGAPGLNGKDGADGMTLDDAELLSDDGGWVLRLSAGGRTKDFRLPVPHHQGPWTAGKTYLSGAAVSWDGSWWIAKDDTGDQPGTSDAWQLVVRRGKQGKEGPRGKDGRDLTPGNTPPLYG